MTFAPDSFAAGDRMKWEIILKKQIIMNGAVQLCSEHGMSDQFLRFSLRHVYEFWRQVWRHREWEAHKTSIIRSHVEWEPKNEKAFLENSQQWVRCNRYRIWFDRSLDRCCSDHLVGHLGQQHEQPLHHYRQLDRSLRPIGAVKIGAWFSGQALFFAQLSDMPTTASFTLA